MDLIWRSEKIINFGIARKKLNLARISFGNFCHFAPNFLCAKIYSNKVGGNLFWRLENYIDNRKQRVMVDGQCSSWKIILSSVPQGSLKGFPKDFKNTKIAVLKHLELKIFFAAQPWWSAFK